jgi:RimJ/RimL family protein N-acetyltransferase
MSTVNPYEQCPVYESTHYTLRLVEPTDANDLLTCYSDQAAVRFMNSDNCSSDFLFGSLEQMQACIGFWLREYAAAGYVRFAVVDRGAAKTVGTIEMFGHREPDDEFRTGIMRVDLCADHERQGRIGELLQLAEDHFYEVFAVQRIITKAIPEATERVAALEDHGFSRLTGLFRGRYEHYFSRPVQPLE